MAKKSAFKIDGGLFSRYGAADIHMVTRRIRAPDAENALSQRERCPVAVLVPAKPQSIVFKSNQRICGILSAVVGEARLHKRL